jgi:DNA polymerase kappa
LSLKYVELLSLDLTTEKSVVAHKVQQLTIDLTRWICHVDMDAFFASVEELDKPELKNIPMAVGDLGMLSTANYVARKYGVRSAMPGYIAKRLCPELVLVPVNFDKYQKSSNAVQEIFKQYDPLFRAASLDEACLDLTDYAKTHPDQSIEDIVCELREKIFLHTGLTASAGTLSIL